MPMPYPCRPCIGDQDKDVIPEEFAVVGISETPASPEDSIGLDEFHEDPVQEGSEWNHEEPVQEIYQEGSEWNNSHWKEIETELKATLKKELLAEIRESGLQDLKEDVMKQLMEDLSELIKQQIFATEEARIGVSESDDYYQEAERKKANTFEENRSRKTNTFEENTPRHAPGNMRLVSEIKNTQRATKSVGELCTNTNPDGVPILDAVANEMGAQDWVYDWAETMWDAMPFIGLGVMTFTDQVLVVLVATLNLVIQTAFIGLVGANMTGSLYMDDDIIGTLQDWRVSYAHNPDFADKFTNTPLGADVCAQSAFMMQGAQQATLYNEILEYVTDFLGMPSGACLSMLSIYLWILTCSKEMRRISLFSVGLWTPNSENVGIFNNDIKSSHVVIQERAVLWVYGEASQRNYQIFLTRCRVFVLTLLVVLPRLCVLLSLGFIGTQFLVATTELDELILNCVALEVVLNVDELLFAIFVPDSALRMVRKTKPLRVPKMRGVIARVMPWLRVVVISSLMAYIAIVSLSPMIQTMREIKHVMCSGDVNFLSVATQFGGVVSGSPEVTGIQRDSYPYRAIYQRTGLGDHGATQASLSFENGPFQFTKIQTLDLWRDRSFAEWGSQSFDNPTFQPCFDEFWPIYKSADMKHAYWEGLSHQVGRKVSACHEVKAFCFNDIGDAGKTVRLLCPTTCGGRDPLSGLFLNAQEDGLPVECESGFVEELAKVPCKDYPLSVLTNSSHAVGKGWKNYADGVLAYMAPTLKAMSLGNEAYFTQLASQLHVGMMTQGCIFFNRSNPAQGKLVYVSQISGKGYPADLCDVAETRLFGRRIVRAFCPETCECHTSIKQRYITLGESWNFRTASDSQCPGACWE